MRYVPLFENRPSEKWMEMAAKATAELETEMVPDTRNKPIPKKKQKFGEH